MGEKRNACRLLAGKRPLERPTRRWVDNIKMNLREKEWGGVNCLYLAQVRDQWRALVHTV
jgi:hypothetical protein